MSSIYKVALEIAKKYQSEQKYGDKTYIGGHLREVVMRANDLFCTYKSGKMSIREIDLVEAIAWLHDVVEDTECTYDDIRKQMLSHEDIYPEDVDKLIDAIDAMTKRKDEERAVYIYRCCMNPLAIKVKIADTLCNLEASIKSCDWRRIGKYTKQINELNRQYSYLYSK